MVDTSAYEALGGDVARVARMAGYKPGAVCVAALSSYPSPSSIAEAIARCVRAAEVGRSPKGPLRAPIVDVLSSDGDTTLVLAQIVAGEVRVGDAVATAPSHAKARVAGIRQSGSDRVERAGTGVTVVLTLCGDPVTAGAVIGPAADIAAHPALTVSAMQAQVILISSDRTLVCV